MCNIIYIGEERGGERESERASARERERVKKREATVGGERMNTIVI